MKKTFIIAEAGANHNRDFDIATKLIDGAKLSGSDAVKFQTYSSETLYAKNTPDIAGQKNINALIKDIELPREWQKDLKDYCDRVGIEFMSTPFDEKAVQELYDLGVKRLKIAGFESTDFRFITMVASTGLPLIISLGIGFERRYIDKVCDIAVKYGNDLTLLHCNNAYPTPIEDIDLNQVRSLSSDTRFKCGLSDHTTSLLTPALAVAVGAQTIEKHFTTDRNLKGPDHSFALEIGELKEMVLNIREAEKALIPNNELYTESEKIFVKARRSVVSKVRLSPGDILSEENITTKRPFLKDSVPASDYLDLIGHVVNSEIEEDTPLRKDQVSDFYQEEI